MKKKFLSILFAVVLVASLSLVMAVPVGAQTNGDVTIVVYQQDGVTAIEGATVKLLFYGEKTRVMEGRSTDVDGSATFTATEIASWLAVEVYDPTLQIYIQPNAKVETATAYGKVRTVDPTTGFPCIPYNTPANPLAPLSAMTFTYNMIMMSTEPVQTVWDDPSNEFTVTATLAESLSVIPDVTKMRLIRNLVGSQLPAVDPDDDWWFHNGTEFEHWIGIGTVVPTVDGSSVSAVFSQDILSDWVEGNKAIVRTEFGVNRIVGGVSCIDDYSGGGILRPSSYIIYPEVGSMVGFTAASEEAFIGISVSPTFINFGAVTSEASVSGSALTVSNTGNVGINVDAEIIADTYYDAGDSLYFYTAALRLSGGPSDKMRLGTPDPSILGKWAHTDFLGTDPIVVSGSRSVTTGLQCPQQIKAATNYTGTVVFWAEQAP